MGIDCSINAVGTLGPIMKSESNVYFGLTAGHVLLDGDRELVVKTEDGELEAILKVAGRYVRGQGRPVGRLEDGDKVGYEDEIILLEIGVQDIHKFNTLLYCVNCHYYMPGNVSKEEASDPMAFPRGTFLQRAMRAEGPIKVYKFGSATGLTTGHLVNIDHESPPGWYESANEESESHSSPMRDTVVFERDSEGMKSDSDDDPEGEDNSDEGSDEEESEEEDEESKDSDLETHDWNDKYDELESEDNGEVREMGDHWLGKIMWESRETPFSAPGDSGALVYALEKGTVIPLGVHLGSPSSWPSHSSCLSIETFCADGKKAGYERLRFAEAESRTMGTQSPSANEEEEELNEEQRKLQEEYMEAYILAKRRPGSQTTNTDEVCIDIVLRTGPLSPSPPYIRPHTHSSNIHQFSYTYTIYTSPNTPSLQLSSSKKADCRIFISFTNYLHLYKSTDYPSHSGSFHANRMKQQTIFQPIHSIYTYLQKEKYTHSLENLVVWREKKSPSDFCGV